MPTGGEDTVVVSPRSANEAPGSRLKFLCSHGGRILPRPFDGHLKYVGGQTRVVSVRRSTTFSELMKKLTTLFEADWVLKYQLFSEDLDALVSVTCDEDLCNMIDEYDRHYSSQQQTPSNSGGGPTRLRAFLFPINLVHHDPSVTTGSDSLEQRYIDAINGVRTPRHQQHVTHQYHQGTPSSNGSSPRSVATDRSEVNNTSNNEVPLLVANTLQRVLSSSNLICNGCGVSLPSRVCCGGQRAGQLAPPGRGAVPMVTSKTLQRSGSGRFYAPVQRTAAPGEVGCHRRQGSGGWGMLDVEWKLYRMKL